jgi:ATP-dependent RNA helicase DDX3X
VRIFADRNGSAHKNIKQNTIYVESTSRRQALYDLLPSTLGEDIIFVNSKRAEDEIDDYLFDTDGDIIGVKWGLNLHGWGVENFNTT